MTWAAEWRMAWRVGVGGVYAGGVEGAVVKHGTILSWAGGVSTL